MEEKTFKLPVKIHGRLTTRDDSDELELRVEKPEIIPQVVRAADHHFSSKKAMRVRRITDPYDDPKHDVRAVLRYAPEVRGAGVHQPSILDGTFNLIKDLRDRADNAPNQPFSSAVDRYIADYPAPAQKVDVHETTLSNTVLTEEEIKRATFRALKNVLPRAHVVPIAESLAMGLADKPRPPTAHTSDGQEDGLWFYVRNTLPVTNEKDEKLKYAQQVLFDELADAYKSQAQFHNL